MTTHQAIAKDYLGVNRVYGTGATIDEAWNNCYREAWQYMNNRPDIDILHLWVNGKQRETIRRNDW